MLDPKFLTCLLLRADHHTLNRILMHDALRYLFTAGKEVFNSGNSDTYKISSCIVSLSLISSHISISVAVSIYGFLNQLQPVWTFSSDIWPLASTGHFPLDDCCHGIYSLFQTVFCLTRDGCVWKSAVCETTTLCSKLLKLHFFPTLMLILNNQPSAPCFYD